MAAPKIIGTPYSGTHKLGNWESDNAYDYATPVGTPLYAAFAGTIGSQIGALTDSVSSRFAGLRLHLVGSANELYYAHLSRLAVKAGDQVKQGQLIGYSGSANGVAHLHLGAKTGDDRRYAATIFGMGAAAKDTGQQAAGSWSEWAQSFLRSAGFPVTSENARFMLGWLKAENPSSDYAWNPLATTLKTKAALRPGGVQAYKDELSGIQATVQTIQEGQYGAVRRALAAGSSSQTTWDALRASPWDAGHYAATPSPPKVDASDSGRLVPGAKKGSGGVSVSGIAGDIWGLAGVSGLDLAGDAAGAAKSGVVDPVVGAVSDAATAVGGAIEHTAIRIGYILAGLLLAGFALLLVVRAAGVNPAGLVPGGSGGGGAAPPVVVPV